jgi:hypothetical protein
MGLKADVTYMGIPVSQAYLKLENFRGSKNSLQFGIGTYVARGDAQGFDYNEYECSYSLVGANPIEQAYAYLKTLPQFETATNVLEDGQTI